MADITPKPFFGATLRLPVAAIANPASPLASGAQYRECGRPGRPAGRQRVPASWKKRAKGDSTGGKSAFDEIGAMNQ
jgi:hypothetical protein